MHAVMYQGQSCLTISLRVTYCKKKGRSLDKNMIIKQSSDIKHQNAAKDVSLCKSALWAFSTLDSALRCLVNLIANNVLFSINKLRWSILVRRMLILLYPREAEEKSELPSKIRSAVCSRNIYRSRNIYPSRMVGKTNIYIKSYSLTDDSRVKCKIPCYYN